MLIFRPTGLGIEARPVEVIASVILVFFGRAGLGLIRSGLALPVLVAGDIIISLHRALITAATRRSNLSQADPDRRTCRIAARMQDPTKHIADGETPFIFPRQPHKTVWRPLDTDPQDCSALGPGGLLAKGPPSVPQTKRPGLRMDRIRSGVLNRSSLKDCLACHAGVLK